MNNNSIKINLSLDFTKFPGGRYKSEGPGSGEEFRNRFLIPHLDKGLKVTVNLDNVAGYPASFLEEAFGGLVEKYGYKFLIEHIIFEAQDDPIVIQLIEKYMKNASKNQENKNSRIPL